jgi:hypothetical protein
VEANVGRYFRTVQEIFRKEPEYRYVIEIRSSAGILGGFDVYVQGFMLNSANVDDNENYLTEWFWRRPKRDQLIELVDRLHLNIRSSMSERNWDKVKDEKIQKEMDDLRKKLEAEMRSKLEKAIKDAEKAASKDLDEQILEA